jgi:hypothetical protein
MKLLFNVMFGIHIHGLDPDIETDLVRSSFCIGAAIGTGFMVLVVFLFGCSSGRGGSCRMNADCAPGYYCDPDLELCDLIDLGSDASAPFGSDAMPFGSDASAPLEASASRYCPYVVNWEPGIPECRSAEPSCAACGVGFDCFPMSNGVTCIEQSSVTDSGTLAEDAGSDAAVALPCGDPACVNNWCGQESLCPEVIDSNNACDCGCGYDTDCGS